MSDLSQAMQISASGMKAQSTRLRVISENLANAQSTGSTPEDVPYRRKMVTFRSFVEDGAELVRVDKVIHDKSDFIEKYDPGHPSANEEGYVFMPNVNSLIEVMDMREAQRSYEANMRAIDLSRNMLMQTIDMLR